MMYMPVERDFTVTSPFGPRGAEYHFGVDYGAPGGSGGRAVYAVKAGRVTRSGPAQGFGRWVTIDHPASNGGGETVYGHIVPQVQVGQEVLAGQRIGYIDPNQATNGGVAPHLHIEWHRYSWSPPGPDRLDPERQLRGAAWPHPSITPTPDVLPAPDSPPGSPLPLPEWMRPASGWIVPVHRELVRDFLRRLGERR